MQGILEGQHEMKSVKVRVKEVLDKVTANREKHIADFEEAWKGFVSACNVALSNARSVIDRRLTSLHDPDLSCVSFDVEQPVSHEKDYDQAIAMLAMCVDLEVTLTAGEFARYIMDDWGWKDSFENVSKMYKSM